MTQAAIAFIGDPHGQWDDIRHQIEQQLDQGVAIAAIVPVGDMELERPLHEELALFLDMGIAVHWIHGNHDSDHAHWHDHLFGSRLQDKTLHALVKEIEGTKLAGLGGVFRGEIWFPQPREAPARFPTRTGFVDNLDHHKRWRKGLPLKHRTSIFPEDFARLEQQESADILVCHEGPSTVVKDSTGQMIGFEVIDDLAAKMGVKLIVHGHHHRNYSAKLKQDIQVRGLGKAELWLWYLDQLPHGEL